MWAISSLLALVTFLYPSRCPFVVIVQYHFLPLGILKLASTVFWFGPCGIADLQSQSSYLGIVKRARLSIYQILMQDLKACSAGR